MTLFILVLASELPDPGQMSFAPLMGTVGLFVSGFIAELRGVSHEQRARWVAIGTWAGTGVGFAVWMLGFAMDPL
jgi:hypothetical protein